MKRAFTSEWTRITRPGYLVGFGGTMVGLTVLLAGLSLALFTSLPVGEAGTSPTAVFEGASGAVTSLFFTLGILGAAALVLGALAVASEYAHGTLRVMLVAHPRRWTYLGGKLGAIGTLVAVFVVTAAVLQVVVSAVILEGRGGDTSMWWTLAGLEATGAAIARVAIVAGAWALIGALLATLLRNAAAAIGIGIGYSIIVEPLLGLVFEHAGPYLPASALRTFAAGGNGVLPLGDAAMLVAAYVVGFTALALYVFEIRDVNV